MIRIEDYPDMTGLFGGPYQIIDLREMPLLAKELIRLRPRILTNTFYKYRAGQIVLGQTYKGAKIPDSIFFVTEKCVYFCEWSQAFYWKMLEEYYGEDMALHYSIPQDAIKMTATEFSRDLKFFPNIRPLPVDIYTGEKERHRKFLFFYETERVRDKHFYVAGNCVYFDVSMKSAYLAMLETSADSDLLFDNVDHEWQRVDVTHLPSISLDAYAALNIEKPVRVIRPIGSFESKALFISGKELLIPVSTYKEFSKQERYSKRG